MKERFLELIDRESQHARAGRRARIVAKMNALVDPDVIDALYRASQAGVEIDLIVRGICCLRPALPGVSERIRVMSIIGRFLEHSRIWHFLNGGQDELYIGSADWMPRNFMRRVEAVVPVETPALQERLRSLLAACLEDNRQAWDLGADGRWIQRRPQGEVRATHRRVKRKYKTRMRMPSKLDPHLATIEDWHAAEPQITALAIVRRLAAIDPETFGDKQHSIVQRLLKALRRKAAQRVIAETTAEGGEAKIANAGVGGPAVGLRPPSGPPTPAPPCSPRDALPAGSARHPR